MAGGKETPRQKMIGMMYLVLTALLALNVSKSILDAFVAIEENIQEANLTELFRGDERKSQIIETAVDRFNPTKAQKAKLLQKTIEEIDKMTADRIKQIDDLKLKILNACNEDILTIGDDSAILREKYDPLKNALKPIRMNLENVAGKDKYDEVMSIMIGDDIKNPTGDGIKLWNSILEYRDRLTEKIASSQLGGGDAPEFDGKYYFKAPSISAYKDTKDLDTKIRKAIDAANVHPDDQATLLEIFKSLTKKELSTVHDIENVHWIGKTFDHAPVVAAIASLSSMQQDILAARADALTLIRSRVSGNDYSFNKVIAVANGPEVVNQGDEFDLNVMMMAYDSDKQPEVTMNSQTVEEVKDGKGIIHLTGEGDKMELSGTISIMNKAGIKRTLDWSKTVHVMRPQGSIELPEFNVLYRGYDNKVHATASGFESTTLGAVNADVRKQGEVYIVRPTGNGRTAQLIVNGHTADGESVTLKRITYRVLRLPAPSLFWGASKNGARIPPGDFNLNVKYGDEFPLDVQFQIVDWSMEAGGARPQRGQGRNASSAAQFVRAVPTGTSVFVTCKVRYPDNVVGIVTGKFVK